jgi:multiple sugar transport system substrate-binding protein
VPHKIYGLLMPGKKYTELTDFCYYLYAAGGDFFAVNADGTYGKSTVNSEAGVKALTFMQQLALKDKVVQDGFTSMDRMSAHPIFYTGKVGYTFIGAWVESAMKAANATFPVTNAQIPPFKGNKQQGLIITDSIAFFAKAKNVKLAGKFVDFFYQDEWKAKFDQAVGFPPVTMSAAKLPQFQTPLYKVLGEAAQTAKGWPLIKGWDEFNNIIWDANEKVFHGQATPKQALDEAAAAIDKSRGI